MRTSQAIAVFALAGVFALAACGQQPEPRVTVSVTAAEPSPPAPDPEPTPPAPDPQPTPSAPPHNPDDFSDATAEGALGTAEYFAQLYPQVMTSGQTGAWDQVATDDCTWCSQVRQSAMDYREAGVEISGGNVQVISGTSESQMDGDAAASVAFSAIEGDLFLAEPGRDRHLIEPASESRFLMDLVYLDGAWQVASVEVQRQPI